MPLLGNLMATLRDAERRAASLSRAHRLNAALYAFALVGLGLIAVEVRQNDGASRDVVSLPRPQTETTRSPGAAESASRPANDQPVVAPGPRTEPAPVDGPAGEAISGTSTSGSGPTGAGSTPVPGGSGGAVPAAATSPAPGPAGTGSGPGTPGPGTPGQGTPGQGTPDPGPPAFFDQPVFVVEPPPGSLIPTPGRVTPLPDPGQGPVGAQPVPGGPARLPAIDDLATPSGPNIVQPSAPSPPRISGPNLSSPSMPSPATPSAPRL